MPISAAGMPATEAVRVSRGFTLLELMVVLVLIGILTGAAVLRLRAADPAAQAEALASRLRAQMTLLRDEAELGASARALRVETDGYRLLGADDRGGWQLLDAQRWPPARLPETLRLQLGDGKADERPQAPSPRPQRPARRDPQAPPQLFWWPSGEATPFTLDILLDGTPVYRLRGDGLGRVVVVPLPRA